MQKVKNLAICLCVATLSIGTSQAQVKIGDNPNVINASSLFELESANKGFLPPRVSLIHTDSISPLGSTTPAGMLVYNNGAAIPKGHYTWNGSKWLLINTSAVTRDNFKIIKSAADFPTASGGVITLSSTVVYEINGTVTVASKINLNGATLRGQDRINDKLMYSSTSGELFTGSQGGYIQNLTVSAPGVGSKIFNVNGGNSITASLILEFVYIFDSDNVGLIKGYGTLVFQSVAFSNNTNGITIEDIGNFLDINGYWIADNKNTYQKFVGAFSEIQIMGGERHALSFFAAKALDLSGITTIASAAYINGTLFIGDGVRIVGIFSKKWNVECSGIDTQKDDVASGNLYVSSVLTTTFSAVNTSVKISGTTVPTGLFRVTSAVSNRLVYDGTKSKRFQVICSLSAIALGNGKNYSFYIAKNGSILPESQQRLKCSSQVDRGSVSLSCTALLAPGDFIEVWVQNNSDATNLTVESLNLAIQ